MLPERVALWGVSSAMTRGMRSDSDNNDAKSGRTELLEAVVVAKAGELLDDARATPVERSR